MTSGRVALLAAALLGAGCSAQLTSGDQDLQRIDTALASPIRTERDLAMDESRKPREFLIFAGVREGDVVAEINAGGGYLARLLPTVVGANGYVYATNATFVEKLFEGINGRLAASVEGIDNVNVSAQSNGSVHFDRPLDVAILNSIYHDLHWQKVDTARFNASVLAALRPGGLFIVGDHSAPAGSGTRHVEKLHRIDRATVIAEIEQAGFVLIDSADFLANPEDDRLTFVIDPAIRGRTDRFLLKFRKPE